MVRTVSLTSFVNRRIRNELAFSRAENSLTFSISFWWLINLHVDIVFHVKKRQPKKLIFGEGSSGKFNDFKLITSWWFRFVDASLVLNINAHSQTFRSPTVAGSWWKKRVSLIISKIAFCVILLLFFSCGFFPSQWIFNFNLYGFGIGTAFNCGWLCKHFSRFTSYIENFYCCFSQHCTSWCLCTGNCYMIMNNWA